MTSLLRSRPLPLAWALGASLLLLLLASTTLAEGKASPHHAGKSKQPSLIETLEGSNATRVKALLENGTDVNETNSHGRTALHLVASSGNVSLVQALLRAGIGVDLLDIKGSTALQLAVRNGHLNVVQALIHAKAAVNVANRQGQTALHIAASLGHTEIAKALIGARAHIDAQDEQGATPLHLAVRGGHADVVKALIQARAQPEVRDKRGQTPLLVAVSAWKPDMTTIAKALIGAGAMVDIRDRYDETALDLATDHGQLGTAQALIQAGARQTMKDKDWALFEVAESGGAKMVKDLVNDGAFVDFQNDIGRTALHKAALHGHVEVLKALIDVGAQMNIQDDRGDTPLHDAARNGSRTAVKALIEAGMRVDTRNDAGQTAMHLAAYRGDADVVQALVDANAQVELRDSKGETPLHKAAMGGDVATVKALIDSGAELGAQSNAGQTALHIAAGNGEAKVVQALVAAGANVKLRNDQGESALHEAMKSGDARTVQVLLEAGASQNALDRRGRTPGFVAAELSEAASVKALLRWELRQEESREGKEEAEEKEKEKEKKKKKKEEQSRSSTNSSSSSSSSTSSSSSSSSNTSNTSNSNSTSSSSSTKRRHSQRSDALHIGSTDHAATWTTIRDEEGRLPWEVTADEEILAMLPKPTWWQQWRHVLQAREFLLAVCGGLAASLPLAALQTSLRGLGRSSNKHKSSEDATFREPSPGAQHLAAAAALESSSCASSAFTCRFFEVCVGTGVLAWSFGYLFQPWLSAAIFLVVYILPSTYFVGFGALLRNPALCFVSSNRTAVADPLNSLLSSWSLAIARCAVLLLVPSFFVFFLDSRSVGSVRHFGLTIFSPDLEGPFVNLQKVAHDQPEAYCLLNPGINYVASQLRLCPLHFELCHFFLPLGLLLVAALISWVASCNLGDPTSGSMDPEATVQAESSERDKLRLCQKLAEDLDKVTREALPDDNAVWKSTCYTLERSATGALSLAEPPTWKNFWKSPTFELALLALDFLLHLFALQNVFLHRCWCSGGALLACLTSAVFAETLAGNTPSTWLEEARESSRLGLRTQRFTEILQHEAAWEALPSLAVNACVFWFAVNERYQFALSLCSLLLSTFGAAKFLHQTVDLQLPKAREYKEEEEQGLLGFISRY